jgi:acetyl-CoA acetyltransferase
MPVCANFEHHNKQIMAGRAEVIVAGGCETFSDLPIRHSRAIRQRLIAFPKASKKVSFLKLTFIVLMAAVVEHIVNDLVAIQ